MCVCTRCAEASEEGKAREPEEVGGLSLPTMPAASETGRPEEEGGDTVQTDTDRQTETHTCNALAEG